MKFSSKSKNRGRFSGPLFFKLRSPYTSFAALSDSNARLGGMPDGSCELLLTELCFNEVHFQGGRRNFNSCNRYCVLHREDSFPCPRHGSVHFVGVIIGPPIATGLLGMEVSPGVAFNSGASTSAHFRSNTMSARLDGKFDGITQR